jgi:hypothetical protein
MKLKITWTKGSELTKTVVEGTTIKDTMRRGYQQCQWDCVLEVTTEDNRPIQPIKA